MYKVNVSSFIKFWFALSLIAPLFKMLGLGATGYLMADGLLITFSVLCLFFMPIRTVNINIFNIFSLILLFLSVIYIIVPDANNIQHKLHGFRLSGLYLLLPFLFLFIDSRKINEKEWYNFFLYLGLIISLNAIRQFLYLTQSEVAFLSEMGGAGRLAGDSYAVGTGAYRVFSTLPTSVHLAAFMSFVLFCIIANKSVFKNKLNRLEITTFITCITALFITYSRTSLLAFIIGVIGFLLVSSNVSFFKKIIFIFSSVILLSLLMIFFDDSIFVMRIMSITEGSNVSAFSSRMDMWSNAIDKVIENPLGYGIGIAGFHNYIDSSIPTDSTFLKYFVEFGLLFGGLFIIYHFYMCYSPVKNLIKGNKKGYKNKYFASVSFMFSLYFIVSMFTNNITEAVPINYLLLLGMCLYNQARI